VTVLIEDSPRNLSKWIEEAVTGGVATGAVLDPFSSPFSGGSRRTMSETATRVTGAGGTIGFDALTHLLDAPGVGDFRYYDGYSLWPAARGDLSSSAYQRGHLARVFAHQASIAAPPLAPTVLIRSPLGTEARLALTLAAESKAINPVTAITIAGDEQFWSSGARLDAHIGALAQFQPSGWTLAVVRQTGVLPAPAQRAEIEGLCRTVLSLTALAPVHVSHGDLAALPAIAAGAATIGSGWDQRQMVLGTVHYAVRNPSDGGGWYERPTIAGVLSRIKKAEYTSLTSRGAALGRRLTPGVISPLNPQPIYMHHLTQLSSVIRNIRAAGNAQLRYEYLRDLYTTAQREWPALKAAAISEQDAREWIDEVEAGLGLYGRAEGW
jgi:hypothetical protein